MLSQRSRGFGRDENFSGWTKYGQRLEIGISILLSTCNRNQPTEELTAKMIKMSHDGGYRGWYGIESSGREAILQGKELLKKYLEI
jgi:hypothetical protein